MWGFNGFQSSSCGSDFSSFCCFGSSWLWMHWLRCGKTKSKWHHVNSYDIQKLPAPWSKTWSCMTPEMAHGPMAFHEVSGGKKSTLVSCGSDFRCSWPGSSWLRMAQLKHGRISKNYLCPALKNGHVWHPKWPMAASNSDTFTSMHLAQITSNGFNLA